MADGIAKKKGKSLTLNLFGRAKRDGHKIVVLTAYDLTSALIAARGGVDALLVGDSLGMVVLGYNSTLPVTVDDMVHHCRAVARAQTQVPIIADMPYGSFHVSPEQTVEHALRLVKEGGAHAVKIEGGRQRAEVIRALIDAEIPVMGHLGLTPQSVNRLGGYTVQGRDAATAQRLREDAQLLVDWGCFALVLECVPSSLASAITSAIKIPTIGIGAGAGCDGQVLVYHDMLGLFGGVKPKFVKQYAALGEAAQEAIAQYVAEVRSGDFPGTEHQYAEQIPDPLHGDGTAIGESGNGTIGSGTMGYLDDIESEKG